MSIKYKEQTYKVAIVTPAGREKYMSVLKPFIYKKIKEGLIDEWQLWKNTVNEGDIAYLESMAEENSKVKIYTIDEEITPTWDDYNALQTFKFFKYSHDDDTIYIRFDDDIVWVEEGCIEKICKARIDNPDAYLIVPNTINSTLFTSWHQEIAALSEEAGACARYNASYPDQAYLCEFTYANSELIDLIHNTFKKRHKENTLSAYYMPNKEFTEYQRFSICSIAWWGKDKIAPGYIEEPQLAYEIPITLGRPNFFVGNALCLHYSYHTQRDYLTSNGDEHLEFYRKINK